MSQFVPKPGTWGAPAPTLTPLRVSLVQPAQPAQPAQRPYTPPTMAELTARPAQTAAAARRQFISPSGPPYPLALTSPGAPTYEGVDFGAGTNTPILVGPPKPVWGGGPSPDQLPQPPPIPREIMERAADEVWWERLPPDQRSYYLQRGVSPADPQSLSSARHTAYLSQVDGPLKADNAALVGLTAAGPGVLARAAGPALAGGRATGRLVGGTARDPLVLGGAGLSLLNGSGDATPARGGGAVAGAIRSDPFYAQSLARQLTAPTPGAQPIQPAPSAAAPPIPAPGPAAEPANWNAPAAQAPAQSPPQGWHTSAAPAAGAQAGAPQRTNPFTGAPIGPAPAAPPPPPPEVAADQIAKTNPEAVPQLAGAGQALGALAAQGLDTPQALAAAVAGGGPLVAAGLANVGKEVGAPPELAKSFWGSLGTGSKVMLGLGVGLMVLPTLLDLFGDDDSEDGRPGGTGFLSRVLPFLGAAAAIWGATGGDFQTLPELGRLGQGDFWRGMGADATGVWDRAQKAIGLSK